MEDNLYRIVYVKAVDKDQILQKGQSLKVFQTSFSYI